jgi:hypothetical protein
MRFNEFKQITNTSILNEGARIDHAEDIVFWEGSAGAARALESLRKLETGGHSDVTIKWDGSPAIIFGRNEDGEFILTDKSGFTAKGYDGKAKSPDDLQDMFLNRSGGKNRSNPNYVAFAQNMKSVFKEYRDSLPEDFRGYFKGDLLYFKAPPVNNEGYFEFKPNIVTYQVKQDSELGGRIAASTTGVVVHRILDEKGTEGPISIDLNQTFLGDDVFVFPPQTVQKGADVNNESVDKLKQGTEFVAEVTIGNTAPYLHYEDMALNQIFPSGWEIHNSRLFGTKGYSNPSRYQDFRDDRVLTYYSLLPGKSQTFTVLLNATYKGRFYLPAIYSEAMYDHGINAQISGKWIIVE